MDIGFVVLCPDRNLGGLKNTLGSIKHHTYKRNAICVIGNDANQEDLKSFNNLCMTYQGGNTITSLVNVGIKNVQSEWAFLLFSGSRVMPHLERRLEPFVKEENNVLYPITISNRRWNFVDGSFNGVMINKKFFEKVGDFPNGELQKQGVNDFELAKMVWATAAIEHGVAFKAIVGLRVI